VSQIGRKSRNSSAEVLTVDAVIVTQYGIPLVMRKYNPYKNQWAIPGGQVDHQDFLSVPGRVLKDALVYAVMREAREEVVDGEIEIIRKIGVYDKLGRDPRGNYVSHAFLARLVSGRIRAASDAKEVKLFRDIPDGMAFDHAQILKDSKVFQDYTFNLNDASGAEDEEKQELI
jgi:8-oxo-dGTP diphosphatase